MTLQAEGAVIGKRLPRKEDARLLTGRGTFVDDVVFPGMLHVAFVRSSIARGRIRSLDVSVARDLPGVLAVLTAADIDRFNARLLTFFFTPPAEFPFPLLARDRVAHVGEPIAMVVAKDRYVAEDAAGLVTVEYDEEDAVVTIAEAMRASPIHAAAESNVGAVIGVELDEDLEATLASAPYLLTRTVRHQRIAQSPMETRGVVANKQGDELLVHISCQSPHLVARYLSMALGQPHLSIRVIAKDVGGAFGFKNHPWREEMSVILGCMLLGRPLKWIEDRWENLVAGCNAREQEITVRIGFDRDGKLLASHSDYSLNCGAFPQVTDANVAVHMFMWAAYKVPQAGFYSRAWYSNTPGLGAYRGPWGMESLARETLLDVAARELGIDPIELRRRNLITKADQPCTTVFGVQLDDITPAECLEKLLEKFDVAVFREEQAASRKTGRYLGLGIAAYIEPTGAAGAMAPMTGELVQLRIEPTGTVTALMSTHSQGHGTQSTMAQVIADQLGVPYEDVQVFEGDSSRGGFGPGAAGSRQGVIGGGACRRAAALLKDKVVRVAAHIFNVPVESITIQNGTLHIGGETKSLRQIAEIAYGEPSRLPPGMESGLEAQYRYDPPPVTYTSAAHACVVEVDVDTGFVKIRRWLSCEDCGNIINPAVVEGQIAGGLAQAIGAVLLEEAAYDALGNPLAVTFKDYLLPSISDIPDFEYLHACTPSQSEGGFRGVGEGGAIIGPPTLVNAIADALAPFGEVPLDLPLTPSKLLSVIEGRPIAKPAETSAAPAAPAPAVVEAPPPQVAAPPSALLIDGSWNMVLATPMGPQPMVGRFETNGTVLKGSLASDQGSQDFEGTVTGNLLKWEMKVTKPMPLTLKYELLVEGDKISGKAKLGIFGTAKVTGQRA
ncbi:xanthine dehydrogenase family protein molybdopterin-binding subunit [Steroidobacter flavus]|uniref:Xanthine dehydrogenase family protein molybdopterin-binding subunit n=1 Tax=Steroidobacter flavus TaxID=1842136 RepID=A0ABV8SZX0_9GAMM